jgi:ribonucleotide reductase beta subunit family protein with ferritin-like domain
MEKVFNSEKTLESYSNYPLFFGENQGLFDTINVKYPNIKALYHEMVSLDWHPNEVDCSQCNIDFKNCPPEVSDMMIKTLAWQWEADSVASRSIAPILAPFISSSELWAAWQRISDNEVVHASAYSEIVRMSFDNPSEVLSQILSVKESITRLETVAKCFQDLYVASHKYALGLIPADQETYNILYKGIISLLLLERIQFMSSFAITFTIADAGWFQPIGSIVKKIAQDELECFTGDTKIILSNGSTKSFQELVDNNIKEIEVISFDEINNKYIKTKTSNIFCSGEREIIELEFEDNYKVKCTSDHKFLTKNRGWVEAGELTEDDEIEHISKNRLAAFKRAQDSNYIEKISKSMKKVSNTKEYIEKRIRTLQDKLKILA